MKKTFLPVFLFLSFLAGAQVESVEMLPDIINKPGTANTEPSFNSKQDILCFYRQSKSENAIMISVKSANNEWSAPYAAIPFPLKTKDIVMGVRMNAAGTRIYFGWKSDIYFSEYLGGNSWAHALRIDEPVSTILQEDRPSITTDEQTLVFLRNIQGKDQSGWITTPFISHKKGVSGWSDPQPLAINGTKDPIEEFLIGQNTDLVIFATATRTAFHNYYSILQDSGYTQTGEINFSSGKIRWISGDLSTALAETFTSPRKIVKIHFKNGWLKESMPSQVVLAKREVASDTEAPAIVKPMGKYYGLIIGVSSYLDPKLNLDKPVKDANALTEILSSRYEFDRGDIKTLLNPTRQEILSALFDLRSVLTGNDNLLIFFAGHGYWDKNVNQGYWWPRDARPNDPSFWLSNSDLREQIRGIKSGHTLLISDACFSGGIFKTRGVGDLSTAPINIQVLHKTRSRRAITSGNLSTVPDQSVFFDFLTSRLTDNQETYLPSQVLFNSLKTAVINNSLNIPQEGVINDSGDEGGDFIFIRKVK